MSDLGHPRLKAPEGTCDCHLHVFDPSLPAVPGATPRTWATIDAYRAVQRRLGLSRAIIVQPTAYGADNRATLAGVAALGEAARGVAILTGDVTDAEIARLDAAGIRGARFQMFPGGVVSWDDLEPVAARVAAFGWHVQLQMDGRLLHEREAMLGRLPCMLVIDHVGKFLEPVTTGHPGFRAILRLLDAGRCWLKLSAAYEVSRAGPPLYGDVGALAKAAVRAAPERMVWASNWPHVSVPGELPDDAAQLDVLLDWTPDDARRRAILVDNPETLYGFARV